MKLYRLTLLFGAFALMAGCTKENLEAPANGEDGVVITATATAPGAFGLSKVNYTDNYSEVEEIADIVAGAWESGDSFTALEINGDVVTKVTFAAIGSGATAEFKSTGAVAADENTTWVAVSGKADVQNGTLVCSYDGQDGTLGKIGNFDYTVAQSTGKSPAFDFAAGKRLSYVLRILLPAGIQYIEFNTGKTHNGGWDVTSAGKAQATISCTEKEAAHMLTLPTVSAAKQVAYLAVPAIDLMHSSENRLAGLIVTIMSADKRLSQGKAISTNLSAKAGRTGTYDMSNLELMARPLPSDAIRMGSISYDGKSYPLGSWAPFNVGGNTPTSDDAINGNLYAWGETEAKTNFSKENYRWYSGGTYNTQRGYKYICPAEGTNPFIEVNYAGGGGLKSGPGTFYDIGGTKYDAARVKWGSEWRIPSNEVCCNLLKDGKYCLTEEIDVEDKLSFTEYEKDTYTNAYGYKSASMGAIVYRANGAELVFYRCSYTDNGAINRDGAQARYWMSCTDYGTAPGESSSYWNRSCQLRLIYGENYVNNKSWVWDGLRIRAILNE